MAEGATRLRHSEFRSGSSWSQVLDLAGGAVGRDPEGYRAGFLDLACTAMRLE